MATVNPTPDPVDDELAQLLAHPEVQRRLDESEARAARGDTPLVDHAEARRMVGLPAVEPPPVDPASPR